MKVFVGIDMSSESHCIHIMDENENKIKSFEISNDWDGFEELNNNLKQYDVVYIGLEKGHGLIVEYLQGKNYLLYSINPKIIKRFKETRWVSGPKDDSKDSESIASFLRLNYERLRPLYFDSPEVELAIDLCEVYNRLTENKVELINRLRYVLESYFPLYLILFSSLDSLNLWKMIQKYPRWGILKQASQEEIVTLLNQNNYTNRKNIQKLLDKVNNYKHCVQPETERALSIEARLIVEELLILHNSFNEIEKEMAQILDNHKLGKVFLSIPGCGITTATHILALFGNNPGKFKTASEAQSYFGTAPYLFQSGKYSKVMMRRACNKMGRRTFYNLAFSCLRFCNWARAYYDLQRSRGKKHSVALRALSNKWVKIVFAMWKSGKAYDPHEIKFEQELVQTKIA